MAKIDETLRSATAVLDRGRAAATRAPGRAVVAAGDTADRLVGDSKVLVASMSGAARKQTYASLGAGDAVAASIIKRGAELPADLKQASTVLANSLVGSLDVARANIRAAVQKATRVPANAADARDKFAERGEQVATDLRHDPVLVRAITAADARLEQVANEITSVAQKVRSRAAAQADHESAATTATPVRLTPASKVPAHKTTTRKTPAGQAPVSVTPTHRAAAHEDQVRADAAAKAADTRKRAALAKEHAAEARKAAALKAAATRKENLEAAAAKRQATATKAAATRKKNAAK